MRLGRGVDDDDAMSGTILVSGISILDMRVMGTARSYDGGSGTWLERDRLITKVTCIYLQAKYYCLEGFGLPWPDTLCYCDPMYSLDI